MAESNVSSAKIGIQTIETLIFAVGNFSSTFSRTARAPLSRHNGHVGESKAMNRICPLLWLNRSFSGAREFSSITTLLGSLSPFI